MITSTYKRFIYNIAVMGDSRQDNTSLIQSLMESNQMMQPHADTFDIQLKLDENIRIEC